MTDDLGWLDRPLKSSKPKQAPPSPVQRKTPAPQPPTVKADDSVTDFPDIIDDTTEPDETTNDAICLDPRREEILQAIASGRLPTIEAPFGLYPGECAYFWFEVSALSSKTHRIPSHIRVGGRCTL
jgi:hypothetical protein